MQPETVIYIGREAMFTVLLVAAPVLATSLTIGLLVSFFQATTHIQEQTLTFVPKVVGVLAVIVIFGAWMMNILVSFMSNLLLNINTFINIK